REERFTERVFRVTGLVAGKRKGVVAGKRESPSPGGYYETIETVRRVPRYRPAILYFAERTPQDNCIGAYKLVFEWADKAAKYTKQIEVKAGGLAPGLDGRDGPMKIDLGKGIDDIDISFRCVAAIAQVWDPVNAKLVAVPVKKVDPNDRSVVLVLEYG